MCGIIKILNKTFESKNSYLIIVTTINILCHLALDEDLSLKIMDKCLVHIVKILFDSFPSLKT